MRYSIEKTRFWVLIGASVLIGALVGGGLAYLMDSGTRAQVASLEKQVAAEKAAATNAAALSNQVQSLEASVTSLTAANSQLTSDLAAAKSSGTAATSANTEKVAVTVVSRKISPSTVATSDQMTMTVVVTGHPDSVTMKVMGPDSNSTYKTYDLQQDSTSGDQETWKATADAPSKKGTYHYFATAKTGSESVTKAGASPSTLTVE